MMTHLQFQAVFIIASNFDFVNFCWANQMENLGNHSCDNKRDYLIAMTMHKCNRSGCPHPKKKRYEALTHWGRVTHICLSRLTIIGSDNGLSPWRCQAIIWTNAGILFTGPKGTNFSEVLIRIQTFSFKKMHLKMSSAKWRPFVSASMC